MKVQCHSYVGFVYGQKLHQSPVKRVALIDNTLSFTLLEIFDV